jgi:hypothetical protein
LSIESDGSDVHVGGGFTRAGGVATRLLATWNGAIWSALSTGADASVYALAAYQGDLYIGGLFTNAGDLYPHYVVKWSGSEWLALGHGLDPAWYHIASGRLWPWYNVHTIVADGGSVYAGGMFRSAGGVVTNHIVRWNGRRWEALGSGTDWRIYSIAVDGANVYIGGNFEAAGGQSAHNVAVWDGSSWSPMGSGLDVVYAISRNDTAVFAGGRNFIRMWDGAGWVSLGSVGEVFAISSDEGDVYVGGSFGVVGGVSASRVAKWDGSTWSALGSGVDGTVHAIAEDASDVYVGGDFIMAGGQIANRIARWDGSAWHPLGLGVGGRVRAIAVEDGVVFAAGDFTTAGGQPANHVAGWDGGDWQPLGSGTNGNVESLAVTEDCLYAGGPFYTAGGKRSYLFAEWSRGAASPSILSPLVHASGLGQNYPNPFNPFTTIHYAIAEPTLVTLRVYNVAGQLVRTLIDEEQTPTGEEFTVTWDGRNDSGQRVSSGVYFYQLVTNRFSQTKKMIVLR